MTCADGDAQRSGFMTFLIIKSETVGSVAGRDRNRLTESLGSEIVLRGDGPCAL
jgi:hypothetical protein